MKKLIALFAAASSATVWLSAQIPTSNRVPAGVLAVHFSGRATVSTAGVLNIYGIFPTIDGIGSGLFNGDADARNAHFTFRSVPLRTTAVPVKALVSFLGLAPVEGEGFYNVYFQSNPNRDLSRIATFSEGELIASFRARSASVTLMPHTSSVFRASLQLATSSDFSFRGRTYNLRNLVDSLQVEASTEPFPSYEAGKEELTFGYGGHGVAAQ